MKRNLPKFTEIPLPGNYRKRKKYRNFTEILNPGRETREASRNLNAPVRSHHALGCVVDREGAGAHGSLAASRCSVTAEWYRTRTTPSNSPTPTSPRRRPMHVNPIFYCRHSPLPMAIAVPWSAAADHAKWRDFGCKLCPRTAPSPSSQHLEAGCYRAVPDRRRRPSDRRPAARRCPSARVPGVRAW